MGINDWPEWLGTAIVGAVLAFIGYVAKQVAEWVGRLRDQERARRSRLVELLAIIRAGDVAWKVQSEARNRLRDLILARNPEHAASGQGFDHLFSRAFESMSPAERELYEVVRAITIHTFRPLNEKLLDWLSADVDFRVRPPGKSPRARLATYLTDLEAHLLLWKAKYEAWIPDRPDHALVYLADEERHGVPFPKGGAPLVSALLQSRWVGA